jgi:hypothetical protein
VAGNDAGTVVVSPRRGFCVGGLSVDIYALSNVEVYYCHSMAKYVKNVYVLTCLTGRRCWRGAVVSFSLITQREVLCKQNYEFGSSCVSVSISWSHYVHPTTDIRIFMSAVSNHRFVTLL